MKLRRSAAVVVAAVFLTVLITIAAGQETAEPSSDGTTSTTTLKPVSEPPIKLVHVLEPGEREYLSPNLIGLQNIAMTYLPLSMNFVNIIEAFREIVNGVRYEIILNAIDTTRLKNVTTTTTTTTTPAPGDADADNEDITPPRSPKEAEIVCRLVILEKPWLTTQWGDKVRELQHSNCTDSNANDMDDDMAARSKALNTKYQRNALFNGGTRNELNDSGMAKLEAQIMPSDAKGAAVTNKQSSSSTSSTTTSTTSSTTSTTTTAKTAEEEDDDSAATTKLPELNDSEKRWLDDIFSVGALNFEQMRRTQNEMSPPKSKVEDESNYVQQQQQEQQQQAPPTQGEPQISIQEADYPIRSDEDVTVRVSVGVGMGMDEIGAEEDRQREQLDETEAEGQPPMEQGAVRAKREVLVGGPVPLDNAEAEERLRSSLDKLASGDGPNYRIGKIYSAHSQIVSGTLTNFDVELIDEDEKSERCKIEIWSRPWMVEGVEVTINCPSQKEMKRRHSRSVEDLTVAEKKTHKKRDHHNLEKIEHLFQKFQTKYGRRYHTNAEKQMRLRIFRQNLRIIESLNRNEMGSAKYGITEFADLTSSEYKMRTGLWQRTPDAPHKNPLAEIPDIELPKEFDWREKHVISEVKNQGQCGSCWAFSVTGNVEGMHAVRTGKLEEYSEQELLDCDTEDSACNGGLPDNAFDAILKMGGLELESDYPYHARKEQCRFDKNKVHVRIRGAVDLPKNETQIAQFLVANGPISIGINANAMQFYRGGVSHPWKALCSHKNLDHGVLIVGYGVSDYPMFKKTLPYWIIKNSWGPKWGEQGYYRVYRGDNTCGVSEMASSAILADD